MGKTTLKGFIFPFFGVRGGLNTKGLCTKVPTIESVTYSLIEKNSLLIRG